MNDNEKEGYDKMKCTYLYDGINNFEQRSLTTI
jgi:hypothetical protein